MEVVGTMQRRSLYGFEMRDTDHRRNEVDRKTHNIKQLWQRTHEILRLAVLGMKGPEIAKILGITPQTVSNTLNSDLGMQKLSELRKQRDEETIDVVSEIHKLLPKAIKAYENILDNDQASLALKKETADTLVMDISGHRAPTKVQGQFAHAYIDSPAIKALVERGKAAALSMGKLVEIPDENPRPVEKVDD